MNPEGSTYQPNAAHIRYLLERKVLDYYENDDVTLKPNDQWPGYYTTKAGQIIPCIFAEGEDLVPSDWKPTGIQCIIRDTPEDERSRSVGQAIIVSTWTVIFTNYGAAETTKLPLTLREVQTRMGRLFSTANMRYVARSEVALEALTVRFRGTTVSSLLLP